MAREERTIMFYPAEVHQALAGFAQRHNRVMPPGELEALEFDPRREPALKLKLRSATQPNSMEFRRAEVAAALILYCRDKRIPLPKNCHKQLVRHDGNPAIRMALD